MRAGGAGRDAGVEADRRGGGQVEALRAAVDRHPDPVVGPLARPLAGRPCASPPKIQATGPASTAAAAGSCSSSSPAPSAASRVRPGGPARVQHGVRVAVAGQRQVEHAAGGRAHRLAVVRVHGVARPAAPRRRRPRRPPGSRCRALPGSAIADAHRDQRSAPATSAVAERHVEQVAHGHDALRGHRVRQRVGGRLGDRDDPRPGGPGGGHQLRVPVAAAERSRTARAPADRVRAGRRERLARRPAPPPRGTARPDRGRRGAAACGLPRRAACARFRAVRSTGRGAVAAAQAAVPSCSAAAGTLARATATSAAKAVGSVIAISERTLRSTSTPATLRPWMNRL